MPVTRGPAKFESGLTNVTAELWQRGANAPYDTVACPESPTGTGRYPATFANAPANTQCDVSWRVGGGLPEWSDEFLTDAAGNARVPATPAEVSPTIAFAPVINPTPVTVNPTPVTVNPTTLDAGERAAIASAVWLKTGRTVDSVTGGVQLSSAAIMGGGGSLFLASGYVAPDNAGIQAARTAAEAVNNRLPAEPASKADAQGTPPGAGADPLTWIIDAGSGPVADADVWITLTADPKTQVIASGRTDTDGTVVFLVDGFLAGTTTKRRFYGWMQKDGVNPLLGVDLYCD